MDSKYMELSRSLLINAYEEKDGENVVCSPFSLYMLLGTAMNAVRGKCQEEIRDVLSDEKDITVITDEMAGSERKISCVFEGGKLNASNGICVSKDLEGKIRKEFAELVQEAFDTEIFPAGDDVISIVNEWASKKTDGMIPKLLDEVSPDLRLILMNAIAFEAEWENPYEEYGIWEECEFTNHDGTVSEVTMLVDNEDEYIEDDFYTGFVKNYKGGKYAFMALLPKKKKSKSFWKRALRQADLQRYYQNRAETEVETKMPEFSVSADMELTNFCRKLGINGIFSQDADFSGMAEGEQLMADKVIQKAFIKVDSAGTKAAAITEMDVVIGCAPVFREIKNVSLDRPFIYAVIERESGLPVFTGAVNRL